MSIPKIIKIRIQISSKKPTIALGFSRTFSGIDMEVTDAINQLSFFDVATCSSFGFGCCFSVIAHQSTKFCISV